MVSYGINVIMNKTASAATTVTVPLAGKSTFTRTTPTFLPCTFNYIKSVLNVCYRIVRISHSEVFLRNGVLKIQSKYFLKNISLRTSLTLSICFFPQTLKMNFFMISSDASSSSSKILKELYFSFSTKRGVIIRSSRPRVFYKKGVLRNFAKFTGK